MGDWLPAALVGEQARAESFLTERARRRITIAILALGGQGGGVLTRWITELGATAGYRAQATSVPGVAQRTGSTMYYVEMIPWHPDDPEPVLSLTPTPGDVDVVIASELMEAGRAMLRGFVTRDLTTLIGSTHRVYAISEKSARGNGMARSEPVLAAAAQRAKRFIGFDMAAAAQANGCGISAVMFGALAGAGVLPVARDAFIAAIRSEKKAVEVNLAGFEAGLQGVLQKEGVAGKSITKVPAATTAAGQALQARIIARLPASSHAFALAGVHRLMDYQDSAYAQLYLDRLTCLAALDDGHEDGVMTREASRYLALWMSYEDTIRVADLKIRAVRVKRVRDEVRAEADQLVGITEFMHPRFREVCETLPRRVGVYLLSSKAANRWIGRLFSKGRFVETTRLVPFIGLLLLASMRRWRRSTLRYAEEQQRIEGWLSLVGQAAKSDPRAAVELIRCQRLVKGYGDTFERGLQHFERIVAEYHLMAGAADTATRVRALREAALASTDEDPARTESAKRGSRQ